MYTLTQSEKFAVMQALQVARSEYFHLAAGDTITDMQRQAFLDSAANFEKLIQVFNGNDVTV